MVWSVRATPPNPKAKEEKEKEMTKKITIEYMGMEGQGETVTKAKQDAGRKIERMLEGYYTPEIIGTIGESYCALLAREPKHGWGYHILKAGDSGPMFLQCNDPDRESARRSVRRHLADLNNDIEFIAETDQEGRADWHHKQEFRRRYAEARAQGKSDPEAHAIACGLPI